MAPPGILPGAAGRRELPGAPFESRPVPVDGRAPDRRT
jgi:hypothetical protein